MRIGKAKNVQEYIASFQKQPQVLLKQMHAAIKKAAPDAEDCAKRNKQACSSVHSVF